MLEHVDFSFNNPIIFHWIMIFIFTDRHFAKSISNARMQVASDRFCQSAFDVAIYGTQHSDRVRNYTSDPYVRFLLFLDVPVQEDDLGLVFTPPPCIPPFKLSPFHIPVFHRITILTIMVACSFGSRSCYDEEEESR